MKLVLYILWFEVMVAILLVVSFMGLIGGVGFITTMAGLILMVIFIFLSMDGTQIVNYDSTGAPFVVYTFSQTSSDVFHGYGGWFGAFCGVLLALLGALRSR